MRYLLNSREMKACDSTTIEYFGVPSLVLMERAALAATEEIEKRTFPGARCLIVCGSGNNGGDGLAVARLLFLKGYQVQIVFAGKREKASNQTEVQLGIVEKYGISMADSIPENETYDVIADSIFGIGLCREISGFYAELIQKMNCMSGLKVAIDIASGVSADNGQILGTAFQADFTVTFGFEKIGQVFWPGAGMSGEVIVRDIGIDSYGFLDSLPAVRTLEKKDLSLVPERSEDGNKATFGKVLIIAGSPNMAGAGVFSAKAACSCGSGLVRILTHESNRLIMQTLIPEAVLITYSGSFEEEKEKFQEGMEWADVTVIGPGIGQSEFAAKMTEYVLTHVKHTCVADADALNISAAHMNWLEKCYGNLVITPHPGEMSRLTGKTVGELKSDLIGSASEFAARYGITVVLKDARTVTACADGRIFINTSGNCGMATAGSGDVLTGVIASMAGQGCNPSEAAALGVYIHGLAGDFAAEKKGKYGMTASDIAEETAFVLKEEKTER